MEDQYLNVSVMNSPMPCRHLLSSRRCIVIKLIALPPAIFNIRRPGVTPELLNVVSNAEPFGTTRVKILALYLALFLQ